MAKKKKSNQRNRVRNEHTGKKVVVNTTNETVEKKKLEPTTSKSSRRSASKAENVDMLYGKENFILLGAGALLVILGLFLMSGGAQDPNEWNADEVYSARRTIIAPLFILAGLVTVLVSIFKKKTVA